MQITFEVRTRNLKLYAYDSVRGCGGGPPLVPLGRALATSAFRGPGGKWLPKNTYVAQF